MEPSAERPRARRWWTEAEDQILRREAELQLSEGSLKDWNRIAKVLPGRTNKDCRKRWSKVSNQVHKGMWTADEDRRLEAAVNMHGYKWTHVATVVGTRHADQCAKRWRHSLNPDLDRGEWTPEDDQALLASVAASGRNWKAIGQRRFPARSTTDIKNRFVILERRRRHTVGPNFTSGRYLSPSPSITNNLPATFPTPQLTLHNRATSVSVPRNAFSPSPSPSDSLEVDAFSENFPSNPHATSGHDYLQRSSDPTGIGLWIPDMPTWPHLSHSMSEPTSSSEDILDPMPFSIAPPEYSAIQAAQVPSTSPHTTLPPSLSRDPIILESADTLGAWPESLALDDPATGSPLLMPNTCGAGFTQLPPASMSAMQIPTWMDAGQQTAQLAPSYDRGPFYSVRRH